jgi:hypothetical protein
MYFGSKFLLGVLRDGEGDGGGGGGDKKDEPLTLEALTKFLDTRETKFRDDLKKEQDAKDKAADKARKAEETKRLIDEDTRKKTEEAERLRKEEELRAAGGNGDQKTQYELKKLHETLNEERKKREASEAANTEKDKQMAERERVTSIRSALGAYQFAKPNNLDVAFKSVRDDIKPDEDGKLVGPGGAPLQDYLNDLFRQGGELEGLLAPKASGGSGATGTGGTSVGSVDIDSIKPGADNSAARRRIAELTQEVMGGRR